MRQFGGMDIHLLLALFWWVGFDRWGLEQEFSLVSKNTWGGIKNIILYWYIILWYSIMGHTTNNIGWVCLQTGDTTFFWAIEAIGGLKPAKIDQVLGGLWCWGYHVWFLNIVGLWIVLILYAFPLMSIWFYTQHVFSVICHVLCSPLKRIWNLTLSEQSKVLNLLATNLGELNWWLDMCNWPQLWTNCLEPRSPRMSQYRLVGCPA